MGFREKKSRAVPKAAACTLVLLVLAADNEVWGQSEPGAKPLVVYLDEERQRFVKFGTYVQLWARYTDMNPGSLISQGGAVQNSATDVSVRRFRASMEAQLTPRTMGFIQLGLNNLNFQSERGTAVELLDAYAEFKISERLFIGGGKSAWNGLSRYSSPSPPRALTLDVPLLALPTLNITNDLLRNLGLWAKGQISRLDYRVTLFKPLSAERSAAFDPELEENVAKFSDDGLADAYGTSAYFKWQFFEKENNRLPFSPGTYLGRKRVVSVGIGYEFQHDRTVHLDEGVPLFNDLNLWAVDLFTEVPVDKAKRTAFTAYAGWFDYDFGPNLIRNIGVNNPAIGVDPELASFNGAGNAFPLVGTGRTFYVQTGFLLPPMGSAGKLGQLQPFADLQVSDFDALDERMIAWNLGFHWLVRGHNSRFSFSIQRRPIFFEVDERVAVGQRKSMFVFQYQFWLQ